MRLFGPRDRDEAARIADDELRRLGALSVSEIGALPRRREVTGASGTRYSLVVDTRREGDVWRVSVAVDDGGRFVIVPLMRDEIRAGE